MSTTTEPLHAARLSLDTDTDPSVIVTAAKQTIHDGNFAARLTDSLACGGVIVTGAPGCIIEGQPAARVTDSISHGSVVMTGTSLVVIGNVGGGAARNGVAIAAGSTVTKEDYFKNLATAHEQSDGGHSIDRHGPDVTSAQLEHRLKTGIAPDGQVSFAPASTKFNSYENWVKTRNIALKEIEKIHRVDLNQPPSPGGNQSYTIRIGFDKPIDEGFSPDGTTKSTKTVLVDPTTNCPTTNTIIGKSKTGNTYGRVFSVDGITGTYTKVAWDSSKNKWIVIQHFPLVKGWDNSAKKYPNLSSLDSQVNLI